MTLTVSARAGERGFKRLRTRQGRLPPLVQCLLTQAAAIRLTTKEINLLEIASVMPYELLLKEIKANS